MNSRRQSTIPLSRSPAARLVGAGILASAQGDLAAEVAAPAADRAVNERVASLLSAVQLGSVDGSVAALARRVGLGATAFRSAVQAMTGQSPREWIEGCRLERAAQLLASSDRSVADIAALCGYVDPFHFSRAFRRRYGQAPKIWRRRSGA